MTMTERIARRPVLGASVVVAVAFAALAIGLASRVGNSAPEVKSRELISQVAPTFELELLDGTPLRLEQLQGKSVIVNFFNSWCAPCREEEPALQEFFAQHDDDADFAMVGIVRDDRDGEIRKWVQRTNAGWTIGFDRDSRAALEYRTTGQPETYAISPDGIVMAVQYGASTVENLEVMLAAARGTAGAQ